MRQFSITYSSEKQITFIARQVISFARDHACKIWLLEGEMGVGKTTLIKAVCAVLGVKDTVQSPTYALVNEYRTADGETLYHFDFYRIKHESEALDMGLEEYLDSGAYCFIEWPSKIPSLLPANYLKISINFVDQNGRVLHLNKHEQHC